MNNGDVFMMDGVREAKPRSDTRALVALWLVGAATVVLAIWGRSIILGIFSALAIPLAICWTVVKLRASSDARRTASN